MVLRRTTSRFWLLLLSCLLLIPVLACNLVQPDADPTATPAADVPPAEEPSVSRSKATSTPEVVDSEPVRVAVRADGSGDFATLAEAVAAVAPGSTIELGSGTYALESVLEIDKPLTLEGAGRDETEISGDAPGAVVSYSGTDVLEINGLTIRRDGPEEGDVLWVGSGQALLEEIRLVGAVSSDDGTAYAGARFTGEVSAYVINCEATGNNYNGLRVEDGALVDIMDCVLSDNTYSGIVYADISSGSVLRTSCTGNGANGVTIMDSAQVSVDDNTLDGNTDSGLSYFDEAGGTASNNSVMNNGLHGIDVYDNAAPVLETNVCSSNGESGIVFFDQSTGVARQNTCSENSLNGIGVSGEAVPLLEDNVCSSNLNGGIRFSGVSTGTARGNTCSENALSGFIVTEDATPLLEDNVSVENTESGLAYFGTSGGTARGNQLARNALHGIDLYDYASPRLEANLVEENTEAGIRISAEASPMVTGNTVIGNQLSGIIVREVSWPTLEENIVEANGESGIILFQTSGGLVRGNEVTANGLHGLSVNDEAQPTVQSNTIWDNAEAGLAYFETGGGIAQDNTITGNKWGIYVIDTGTPALGENDVRDNETDFDDRRPADQRPTPPPATPQVAEPTVAPEDGILFADDFSAPDPGWWIGIADEGEVWVEDEELRLLNWTDQEFSMTTELNRSFTDSVLTCDVRHVEGSLDNWHDVMCRDQGGSQYVAGYSADGYVKMYVDYGGDITYFLDITASPLVKQGTDVVNQVELACVGNTVRFSLNGEVVGEFTDDTLVEGGIGFAVSSMDGELSTIGIDNVVVRQP